MEAIPKATPRRHDQVSRYAKIGPAGKLAEIPAVETNQGPQTQRPLQFKSARNAISYDVSLPGTRLATSHLKQSDKIFRKGPMVRFALSQIEAGWAYANVSNDGTELTVTVGYTPTDAVRDFVDAVASLRTIASAHCCWF